MKLCYGFRADLNESSTDYAVDVASSQKGSRLIDTMSESGSTSTELEKLADGSTSGTEIASDWSELAGLSSTKKAQEASRATQVCFDQKTYG